MMVSLIISIVTFSVLTTIVENIYSDSVYKKYISQFTGILFIVMLINPVLNMFSKVEISEIFDKWKTFFLVDDYRLDTHLWEEEYTDATKKEFEKLLEIKLSSLLGDLCEIKECEVTFAGKEKDNYGGISALRLSVGPRDERRIKKDQSDEDKIEIIGDIDVNQVVIREKADKKDKNESRGYKEMIEEIKRRISDYLSLEEENIIIDYV